MPRSLTDLSGLNVNTADFLAAMLEATGQPMWVVDRDGLIRFANPAALAALGYDSADELFGRHSHETIHYQHPDGTPYPAAECPMLLPQTTGEVVAERSGLVLPARRLDVPRLLRLGAARDVGRPRRRRGLHRHRGPQARRAGAARARRGARIARGRRCGGSRRWWPAGRRRRRCSPRSPGRWRECWAFRWSRCGATSPTGRGPWSAPGASLRICLRPAAAGRSTTR